jgi:serine/threonine-protein kinase
VAVFICQSCGNEHSSWEGKCPKCGQTEIIKLNQAQDKMIDKVIKGKFKLIRKLGQGGMGAVYLAEQMGIGHRVAIKFLKSEFSDDVEIARRFMREAKSYARVAHPNAVVFHDFGQDEDGNLFIAMEYCEGVDLKKVIQEQKRLPVADAVDIILQVADVLANAHLKGVIHRDLKPENIMLRKGMRGVHAKVLDFGIARVLHDGTQLTVQGAIAGTPRYMSPEQVEGRDVDNRADIYALGILTFETLTGVQPFDGNTIAEILRRQVMDPMPHLSSVSPDVDFPEIDAVLQKACAKRPDDRYPDMTAFASALAQATPTHQGRGLTGILRATESAATADDGTNGTVVRAESLLVQKPKQSVLNATINENMPGRLPASDSIVVAPRSKAPWIVLGLTALAVAGASGVVLLYKPAEVVVPPPPVAKEDPKPKPPVDPQPPPPQQPTQNERDADRGRDYLARGKNAWERGDIEEAYQFFKDVPEGTDFKPEATTFMGHIDTIREKLKAAQAQRHRGNCDAAIPLFNDVLKLNGKIGDASGGLKACQAAALPGTIE